MIAWRKKDWRGYKDKGTENQNCEFDWFLDCFQSILRTKYPRNLTSYRGIWRVTNTNHRYLCEPSNGQRGILSILRRLWISIEICSDLCDTEVKIFIDFYCVLSSDLGFLNWSLLTERSDDLMSDHVTSPFTNSECNANNLSGFAILFEEEHNFQVVLR